MTEPKDLRIIPHTGERIETGPVQFGEDWPGIFIRGDNALGHSIQLHALLKYLEDNPPTDTMALFGAITLTSLVHLFEQASVTHP